MTLTASRPSASLTADLLGFSEHHKRAPQRIAQEEIKKKKEEEESGSFVEEHALLMSGVGGQEGQTLVKDQRKSQ